MCGIAGAMSTFLSNAEIERFQQLMVVSTFRGRWGAGLVSVHKKNRVTIQKTLGMGSSLVYTQDFHDLIKKPPKILLGHCRWPTKGGNSLDDAHPHRHNHIVGVHNGTMHRVGGTFISDKENDSALLIQSIAEKGIEKTIEESSGAYCIVWIDENKRTLNFLRNSERPLYIAHPKINPGTVYWASEAEFLKFVFDRSGPEIVIEKLPEDRWLEYSLYIQNPIKPVSNKEVKKTWAWQEHTSRNLAGESNDWWENEVWDYQSKRYVPKGQNVLPFRTNTSETSRFPAPKTVQTAAEGFIETKPGFYIHPVVFQRCLDRGCSFCGVFSSKAEHEAKTIEWFTPHEFICDECRKDEGVADKVIQ